MVYQFKFPDVGEGIHEGEIVKWHVKVGDSVKEDQVIAEVETDKAVVEIPSPKTGKILKLNGNVGDTIQVGTVIAEIDDGSGGSSTPSTAKTEAPSQPEKKVSSSTKEAGATESTEAKQQGATKKEAPANELPPESGDYGPKGEAQQEEHLEKHVEEAEVVKAKTESISAAREPTQERAKEAAGATPEQRTTAGRVLATPATRKLARELGVDLSTVSGTGAHGRITTDDVQKASKGETTVASKTEEGHEVVTKKPAPSVSYEKYGQVLKIPFKSVRKAIAENLSRSVHTAVHVTHHDEVDVTDLVALRNKEKGIAEAKGFKLTYLAFVVKAVCAALKNHPFVNASLDDASSTLVLKKYYNIGIAVQTDKGLLVPVITNADRRSIMDTAKEIFSLAEHAREGELTLDDMKGGTFTITNIGGIGGIHFTPIINHPECAILGTGKVMDKVVVRDGKAEIRKIMPLSLTFDHRIIDGAQAAEFCNELMSLLSDPDLLMMQAV